MRNKKIINLIVLSLIIVFLLDTPPVSAHDVSITGGVHLASPSAVGNATDFLGPTAVGPLVFDAYKADDDNINNSAGNNNGIVECGETIELFVDLLNTGADTAATVNATLSTSDPYVIFIFNTSSNYPDIPGGGTGTNGDDYDLAIDANTPNEHLVTFDLNITSSVGGPWTDSFTLPVSCEPRIQFTPSAFDFVVPPGGNDWDTLIINNTGVTELEWDIFVGTDPDVIGDWVVNYDWDCNGSTGDAVATFSPDHTFADNHGGSGTWDLNNSQIVWTYTINGTQYTGLIAGNYMAGTMVMFNPGGSGCWTAERALVAPVTLVTAEKTASGEFAEDPRNSSEYLPSNHGQTEIVKIEPGYIATSYIGFDLTTGSQSSDATHTDLSTALEATTGGNVLWDVTHGIYLGYDPTNFYSSLVTLLNSAGFSIYTTSAGLDNLNLAPYDIIVVNLGSSWTSGYTPSEVAAIDNFVNAGGGLLVMGDNPDVPNVNINPVAQTFGCTSGVSILSPNDLYINNFTAHPIFAGVTEIYNRAAGELTASAPSSLVAWEPGDHGVVSVAEVGAGKVVILGDMNLWDNTYISNSQNQLFAENVFTWLSKPWLSADPIYDTTPAGGSSNVKVSVDATDKLPGLYHGGLAIASNDPRPDKNLVIIPVTMRVNVPPSTPMNPSPADGSVGESNNVNLGWQGGDPDPSDTVTYDVYFDTNNPPINLICDDVAVPVCDPGLLSGFTTYFWKVIAEDDLGVISSGDVWHFRTGGNVFLPLSIK